MKKLLFFGFAFGLFIACKDKDKSPPAEEFNKTPIMENVSDNCIIPQYAELHTRVTALETAWNSFITTQDLSNLTLAQNAYLSVAEQYQRVKLFDFGPAMDNGLNMAYGIFPTDTAQIIDNCTNAMFDLSATSNNDAQGLDAIDYLLFRQNALTQLQASANTRQYVSTIITKLKTIVSSVSTSWQTYRSTFVAGTGTSITSPFSLLVNALCKDFEVTKSSKLGFPIGKQTLGITQPLYFEAKWSGHNKTLLAISLETSSNVFKGLNGTGFDDYLIAIEKQDLANSITTHFDYLNAEIANWNESLQVRLVNDQISLENYYDYMQSTIVYLKTDMPSAFGVVISYQDNDGD